jgi:hypothetical protein
MTHKTALPISLLFLTTALTIPVSAQMASGGQSGGEVQQKVAVLKESVAENQQRLHQYQWVETTQLTLKGEPKPPKQNMCSYGPDGQEQKVPIGDAQPQPQSGRNGRLKQHVVEKKTEEMKDYMQQVKGLLSLYVPPNSQRIQAAHQAGNISIDSTASSGVVQLVFKNYAQPGDQMTLAFNTAAKKVQQLNVNTYLGDAKDAVTLAVQFASLPDGTNYAQQTVLNAPAKKIQVTTTDSNYQRLAQ